jgi:hypothetical protein
MVPRRVFKSLGAVVIPAAILLNACPPPTNPPPATTTTTRPTTTTAAPTTTRAPSTTAAPTTTRAPSTTAAPTTTRPPVTGAQFVASFDTAQDFFNRFQRQVFFGGGGRVATNEAGQPIGQWHGDHNMACEAPTTQRTVHSDGAHDAEMFWWCAPGGDATKGHIMTSMYTGGYAQVLFSPTRSFTAIRKVCWDQSMVGLPRKWTQVVIVPESLYQANGGNLHYVNPQLLPVPAKDGLAIGPMPRNSLGEPDGTNLLETEAWARGERGQPAWDSYLLTFTNGSLQQWSRFGEDPWFNSVASNDKSPRFQQCFEDLENGRIRHTNILGNGQTRVVELPGSIPNGPARVIFQDDTYDSFKTDLGDRSAGTNPLATWHWDNILIF